MDIQFGENKIKCTVKGEAAKHIQQGDEVFAVLTVERRNPKCEGPGYRLHFGLKAYEKRTDSKYGHYMITKSNSDWMIHSIGCKFMTDVPRRTPKTDKSALEWVKENLKALLEQFGQENPDVTLLEEVI